MEAAGIYAREYEYLDRYVQVGIASGRVISVSFPREPEDVEPDHEILDRIQRYLEGARDDFADVEIALMVPTERRTVLETLRSVPYGEQISVERLARRLPNVNADDESDLDRVREALAENPTPLLIPDHRVRDGASAAPPDVEQKLRSLEGL